MMTRGMQDGKSFMQQCSLLMLRKFVIPFFLLSLSLLVRFSSCNLIPCSTACIPFIVGSLLITIFAAPHAHVPREEEKLLGTTRVRDYYNNSLLFDDTDKKAFVSAIDLTGLTLGKKIGQSNTFTLGGKYKDHKGKEYTGS
ncbi:hypothetical protein BT96DRAFT_720993 [Gymnopus androsaceus JB14]|uniref:Uncharacterized protein n=1 Tax=Gymnopus androsaceus JB14 TaxID=1447944 RepID=A0A6A4HM17_9AGAR|nr:hypothetical protein BT96DRAFT_720993 [Gymnopus androsaceus JB14]